MINLFLQVQRLYESGYYEDVVMRLMPTLHQPQPKTKVSQTSEVTINIITSTTVAKSVDAIQSQRENLITTLFAPNCRHWKGCVSHIPSGWDLHLIGQMDKIFTVVCIET